MDDIRFDRLAAALATNPSRRRLLGTLLGTALARVLGWTDTAAAKQQQKKKKKNKKKQQQCPVGRPRCGNTCCEPFETCQGGRCVHHCTDGQLNGGESDTDCGRVCVGIAEADRCGLRKRCAGAEDCTSGKCQEPQPGAGVQCVECLLDSECTSPIFRRCLDNFCFECALDADCPSAFGSPAERLCVVIDECPRNQPCVCRQCRQDSDCLDPQRPHCDTGTNSMTGKMCRECLQDSHCPPGQFCIEPVAGGCAPGRPCRCRTCRSSTDCPQGQICDENGNCVNQAGSEVCNSHDDCPSNCCKFGTNECSDLNDALNCGSCGSSCIGGTNQVCVRCCDSECKHFSRQGNVNCVCP